MDDVIKEYLASLEFGELRRYREVAVLPVFSQKASKQDYLTAEKAIREGLVVITEVSAGGSVPELKVINNAELPVLLLDGEELVGAKQNRVLNTTILLKEKSETVIPVSCCEQGRWSSASKNFAASNDLMPAMMRYRKVEGVSANLRSGHRYASQQGEVWNDIKEMQTRVGVDSVTGAMKDVFDARKDHLKDYLEAFPCEKDQKGILVFLNGKVLGFDVVSLSSAYQAFHEKLVRSYTLDVLAVSGAEKASKDKAAAFIKDAQTCIESRYESVGYGFDYRYEARNIVGSVLAHREEVVHAAFFRTEGNQILAHMSGVRQRSARMMDGDRFITH